MNHKPRNRHSLKGLQHNSTAGKYLLIAILVIVVDQLTKRTAQNTIENKGILFGFSFNNSNEIMIGASIAAAVIILIITLISHARGKIFYALILGGIIGNLIDRLTLGYVVDFIRWGSFPVFNVADACISVSVVLLLIYSFWDNNIYRRNRDRLMSRLRH